MRPVRLLLVTFVLGTLLLTSCGGAVTPAPAAPQPTQAPAAAPQPTQAPAAAPQPTQAPAAAPQPTQAPAANPTEAPKAVEAPTAAPQAAEGTPKQGGKLTIALPVVVHLDANSVNQVGINEYVQLFYETLVDRDASGKIVPLLIKEIQQSPDGLVHTWKLQPNVKFHDGTTFDAEAVKFNLDRKIAKVGPLGDMIPWDKIEVVDPSTVKVTLTRPYPGMYNILAIKTFSMYSPTWVKKVSNDDLKSQAVGTGPFMLAEYVPNETVTLKKNPDYWQKGMPYLDEVILKVVPDANARATMLEAGEVDIAESLSYQALQRLETTAGVKVLSGPSSKQYYLSLTNIHPPLDNIQVRQALNYAIDKDGIIETVLRGYAEPAQAVLVTKAVDGFVPAGTYEYNPDKAKQLLDEAGWKVGSDGIREKDGKKFELKFRMRKDAFEGETAIGELAQGMLQDVGVKADIEIADNPTFLAELNKPIAEAPWYDMVNLTFGTFTGDAEYVLKTFYACDAWPPHYWGYAHYCNKDVDKMIADGDAAPSLKARNAIYAQIIKKVWEEAPTIPLADAKAAVATRDYVRGIYLDSAQTIWPAKYVWLDK
jgi:glutathione transport system substrate-binding protein